MNFLILQTAFIGDVILATPVLEKLHQFYPDARIDFLLKKGHEELFQNHPFINEVIVWDKKKNKLFNLWKVIKKVRSNEYDVVINLHRFASSGIITALSGAKSKIGFNKNPLSLFYTKTIPHDIGSGTHEVERNHLLIAGLTDTVFLKPRLHPSGKEFQSVQKYTQQKYICIAPASVWYTKQLPLHKWVELIKKLPSDHTVYLLGAPSDKGFCDRLIKEATTVNVINLAGQLSFLESAALMQSAHMNYVNDSAPMHMASAMNAPVTAIYCSTVPAFGFGPLSDHSKIIETKIQLACRPCGLHGFNACPLGHFDCAMSIEMGDE